MPDLIEAFSTAVLRGETAARNRLQPQLYVLSITGLREAYAHRASLDSATCVRRAYVDRALSACRRHELAGLAAV